MTRLGHKRPISATTLAIVAMLLLPGCATDHLS